MLLTDCVLSILADRDHSNTYEDPMMIVLMILILITIRSVIDKRIKSVKAKRESTAISLDKL